MIFEIKHRFSGEVIFKLECESMKLCVVAALKSEANLSEADLSGADLSGANLFGANLSEADLTRANLTRANLSEADLSEADLSGADLSGANLTRANLTRANLFGADLSEADLSEADLSEANLFGANLTRANLTRANLTRANLNRANLTGADLSGAKDIEIVLSRQKICPTEGAFVCWKKLQGGVIARLVIPHDAERMNALGSRKCRASKVFVHELFGAEMAYDQHTGKTLYRQGSEVFPNKFDPDVRVECSHGIHFFMTREEAEYY